MTAQRKVKPEPLENVSLPQPAAVNANWQGAMWKILTCLCFAIINGSVRYINGGAGGAANPLPSSQIVFLQYAFGLGFMLPWLFKQGLSSLKSTRQALHLTRVAVAVAGVVLWYAALFYLPIATVIALSFTNPIFTIIGAKLYLKENIGVRRLAGIALGFVGTLVIMRPDKSLFGSDMPFEWFLFLPLLSATAFAGSKLISRRLASRGESVGTLTTYLLVFMAPISLIPACFEWVMPTAEQWMWLLGLGGLATLAQVATAKAFQLADVTFLNPIGFMRLVFSTLIGYLAFAEVPASVHLWAGVVVIIGGLYCLTLDNKYRNKIQIQL